MIFDFFRLAFKNLKKRGARSWLTLIGIFIGVTAVVALISLGNSLELAVSSQFGVSQTELITVQASGAPGFGPPGSTTVDSLTKQDLEAIKKLSSVDIAISRNIESGKLEYNDKIIYGYLATIPSGEDRDFLYEQVGDATVNGRLLKDSDTKKIFVGYNFIVDKVGLDKEVYAGKKVSIQEESFEVVGVLEKKGSFIFDNAVYMNEDDADALYDFNDEVDVILIRPRDKNEMDRTKEDIEKLMRDRRDVKFGEEDFTVQTPEASLSTVKGILGGVQIFVVLIAFISIFIGALGIVNTMTTSVWERRKEIGIMKSIGARNSNIFAQFFIEASLLGLIGGLVGCLFGILIGFVGTAGINNFIGAEIKPVLDFGLIFFTLLGSFLIGGLAGIAPAMRAAKQNPVEALRG
jgi:putative ABC transport system permease protein